MLREYLRACHAYKLAWRDYTETSRAYYEACHNVTRNLSDAEYEFYLTNKQLKEAYEIMNNLLNSLTDAELDALERHRRRRGYNRDKSHF